MVKDRTQGHVRFAILIKSKDCYLQYTSFLSLSDSSSMAEVEVGIVDENCSNHCVDGKD